MEETRTKIALEGPDGDVETLWATAVGRNLFELDNLPWYAYDVSAEDIVEALPDETGQLRMTRVVYKSGNRTIRVLFERQTIDDELTVESTQTLDGLVERGCSVEGATRSFVAVNVPPVVDVNTVAAFLDASRFQWEYGDPSSANDVENE